jgi:hypothetical protein
MKIIAVNKHRQYMLCRNQRIDNYLLFDSVAEVNLCHICGGVPPLMFSNSRTMRSTNRRL